MKFFINLLYFLCFVFFTSHNLNADTPHFVDFRYVLNEGVAGKKAQTDLKKRLEKNLKEFQAKEKTLQESEKKIIQQKKIITPEEYKKKVQELRSQVSKLQTDRNKFLKIISEQRQKAKNELLKNVNPIIENYMKSKGINMVIDKRNILVASQNFDITKEVIKLLNEKVKTVNYK